MRTRVMGPRLGFAQGIGPGQIQLDKGRDVGYSVAHPLGDRATISAQSLTIDAGRQTVEHGRMKADSPSLAGDGRFFVGTCTRNEGPWQERRRQRR